MRHQTELSYVWFLNASTAINSTKIPSYCTMYVSEASVMERLCCTTHRPPRECVVVPCRYTSLCVNRKECKQHLTTECIFQTHMSVFFFFFFFFLEWETEKGKMLGNICFCLNIHWCWWNRNCKHKYKHAYSIKNSFFPSFFFFTARRCPQQLK